MYSLYRVIAFVPLFPVPAAALPLQVMLGRIGARCSVLQLPIVHHWKNGGHGRHSRCQRRVRSLRAQGLWVRSYIADRTALFPRKRSDALSKGWYGGEVLGHPAKAVVCLQVRLDLAGGGDRVSLNRRRRFDRLNTHWHGLR